jgi:hypothetical protein
VGIVRQGEFAAVVEHVHGSTHMQRFVILQAGLLRDQEQRPEAVHGQGAQAHAQVR